MPNADKMCKKCKNNKIFMSKEKKSKKEDLSPMGFDCTKNDELWPKKCQVSIIFKEDRNSATAGPHEQVSTKMLGPARMSAEGA